MQQSNAPAGSAGSTSVASPSSLVILAECASEESVNRAADQGFARCISIISGSSSMVTTRSVAGLAAAPHAVYPSPVHTSSTVPRSRLPSAPSFRSVSPLDVIPLKLCMLKPPSTAVGGCPPSSSSGSSEAGRCVSSLKPSTLLGCASSSSSSSSSSSFIQHSQAPARPLFTTLAIHGQRIFVAPRSVTSSIPTASTDASESWCRPQLMVRPFKAVAGTAPSCTRSG